MFFWLCLLNFPFRTRRLLLILLRRDGIILQSSPRFLLGCCCLSSFVMVMGFSAEFSPYPFFLIEVFSFSPAGYPCFFLFVWGRLGTFTIVQRGCITSIPFFPSLFFSCIVQTLWMFSTDGNWLCFGAWRSWQCGDDAMVIVKRWWKASVTTRIGLDWIGEYS